MRLPPCLANLVLLGSLMAQGTEREPIPAKPPTPVSAADAGTVMPTGSDSAAPAQDPTSRKAGEASAAAAPGNEPEEPDGAAPVPEPSALFLVGTGLLGVAVTARLRRRERPTDTPPAAS
ncbi:MAG: PEP-CTERM sorting domain-containing protein [bacterium]|nr:PEP-CTERM sorting domain-containing protein [bacterium]